MSTYTNQTAIGGYISPSDLIRLTDDTGSGNLNLNVLNQVIATVSNTIDAMLSGQYNVPFNPIPTLVSEAATVMACHSLCRRRLVSNEANPYEAENKVWLKKLEELSLGQGGLDANTFRAFTPGAIAAECTRVNQSSL